MCIRDRVITLCAATHKEFLDIDKRAVKDFQNGLLEYFDRVHPEIGQEIEANKALTDELTQKILDVTAEYKSKK